MAKMTAPGVGMKKKMGGMDGARKSAKKQITALLPTKPAKIGAPGKRMAKMEKMDVPV